MKKIINHLFFLKDNSRNIFMPLIFSYANNANDDNYYYAKNGSSPASGINRNNNTPSSQNQNEDINDSTGNNENDIDEDKTEESEINDSEEQEEDLEETQPTENEDEKKDSKINKLKNKLLRTPSFYLYTIVGVIIIFIILVIIVFFWNPKMEGSAILCGGPSKLDNVKVITTDEDHIKLDAWDFYEWIAAVVYWEMGGSEGIIGQVQAIAAASETLQGKYSEKRLAEVREKYLNNWCPEIKYTNEQLEEFARDGKSIPLQYAEEMVCQPWTRNDELEVVILRNSHRDMGGCDIKYGCFSYENPDIPEFGIKKGKCINVIESRRYRRFADANSRKRYCPIDQSLDIDELKLKYPEKTFVFDSKKEEWTVLVIPNSTGGKKPLSEERQESLNKMIASVAGIIMVNDDGSPAYTPWKSGEDSATCSGTNLYQDNAPIKNDMCHDRKVELSMVKQANERFWPVHKILTYWYDYRIASLSQVGRSSCQIYYPFNDDKKGTQILNKLDPPKSIGNPVTELDYVIDHKADVSNIIAKIQGTNSDSEIKNFNAFIENNVKSYGIGTARGVALAAISLINYLESFNYRLPYSWGGKYTEYGIDPLWGSPVENTGPSRVAAKETIPLGFDCTGFTDWVLHNGGLRKVESYAQLSNVNAYVHGFAIRENDLYRKYEIRPTHSNIAYLGDIIYRVADNNNVVHSKVVIGIEFDKNGAMIGNLVAEAKGTDSGVVVSLIDDRTGKPLFKEPIIGENGEIIDYQYSVKEDFVSPTPYGVIDLSNCYNRYGKHYTGNNLCTIESDEEFFKIKENKF